MKVWFLLRWKGGLYLRRPPRVLCSTWTSKSPLSEGDKESHDSFILQTWSQPAALSTSDTKRQKNGTQALQPPPYHSGLTPWLLPAAAPLLSQAAKHRLQLAFQRNLWDGQGAGRNPGVARRMRSGEDGTGRTGCGSREKADWGRRAGDRAPQLGAQWAARLWGTRGTVCAHPPSAAPAPLSAARAASYLVAPGSRLGDREPRGSPEPRPPLAPPSRAPPFAGLEGGGGGAAEAWRGREGRGADGPGVWQRGPAAQAPLAASDPSPLPSASASPRSHRLGTQPASLPPAPPARTPLPASGGVDTCSTEIPILQTFIERPPSARHCARGWGFKGDQGKRGWI